MESSEFELFRAQAQIMKALAHPTRLFIAHQLGQAERCVCELTALVGDDISTISRHLSIMKNAGIVDSRKKGTSIFYALKMRCVLNFFTCINTVLEKRLSEQQALVG